jgi:hypothetical protein
VTFTQTLDGREVSLPARQMIIAVRCSTLRLIAVSNTEERRLFTFTPTERALAKVLEVGRILTDEACLWTNYILFWIVSVTIVVDRISGADTVGN